MKKKNVIICGIIGLIVIGLIVFLVINNIKQGERNYEIEEVKDFSYFVLQEEEKYGVIDKESKIIIDPKFENVIIPNPSKQVFICTTQDGQIKVLNDKNEELFKNYEEVNCIKLKNIASNLMYEKSVLKYKKDGKYGLIDYNGKEITKPIYGSIEALEFKEGELIVEQDGKFGVINIKGVNLVKNEYEIIKTDNYYTEENGYKKAGYIVGIKTEEGYRYGYIDVDGNKILDYDFNDIIRVVNISDKNNIYFIASKNGQYGVYKNNNKIINTEYQSIEYNKTNNIFILEKSRKYGFADIDGKIIVDIKYSQIDINGKNIYAKEKQSDVIVLDATGKQVEILSNISKIPVLDGKYNIVITNKENQTLYAVESEDEKELIPGEYTYIEYLFDNYFIACNKSGMLGVIDDKNDVKIDFKYNSIQALKDTKLIQTSITKENITTIFNNKMEEICKISNAKIEQIEEYIKLYNNEEIYYINKEGEIVSNKQVYSNNLLFAKKQNGKWGFVDDKDQVKVDFKYEKVTEFNNYGYAGIYLNGKWGVVDSKGSIVLEPVYELDENIEPDFLGKYIKVTFGFGEVYYTNKIIK